MTILSNKNETEQTEHLHVYDVSLVCYALSVYASSKPVCGLVSKPQVTGHKSQAEIRVCSSVHKSYCRTTTHQLQRKQVWGNMAVNIRSSLI